MSASRLWLALAGLLLVAGCAAQPGGSAEGGREQATTRKAASASSSSSTSVIALPLDAYLPSAEQQEALNRAHGLLERDCMRRLGFTSWQPPDPRPPGGARLFAFGIVDEQQAARYGYHDPHTADLRRMWVQQSRISAAQRAQQRAELAGETGDSAFGTLPGKQVPPGGCSGEADRRLREGAPPRDTDLYGELVAEANQRTVSDRRVRAVTEAWSQCMKRNGFEYKSPAELAGPEGNRWPTPEPLPVEIATAKADVACKQRTDLPRVWLDVLTGYQRQLIEERQLALEQLKQDSEYELQRANEVVKGHGG